MPCVHLAHLCVLQVRKDQKALPSLEWKVSTLSSGHKVDMAGQQEPPQGLMGGARVDPPTTSGRGPGGSAGRQVARCLLCAPPSFSDHPRAPMPSSDHPISARERKGAQGSPAPPRTGGRANKKPHRPDGPMGRRAALVGPQGGRGGPGDPMGLT